MSSIELLDAKCALSLLCESAIKKNHITSNSRIHQHKDFTIYELSDFLTQYEVQTILNNVENHYEYLEYRNSYRCIAIDSNKILSNLISDRLKQNDFLSKLSKRDPSGFNNPNIEWGKNDGTINTCIRINKYVDSKFDYHRDANLTCNPQLKSNYTLLIYLSNHDQDGFTEFLIPTVEYLHNGLSMKEELELIGDNYNTIKIKPKIGTAVIFDHGIIHRSTHTCGTKYVLRTDLICKGNKLKTKLSKSTLYKSLEDLTTKLFRQAQLNELEGKHCGDLYERCLSLRIKPETIKNYPQHLLHYLDESRIDKTIVSSLKLISRSSSVYTFEYNTLMSNKFDIIKTAILFALNTLTCDITDELIQTFNSNLFGTFVKVNNSYEKQNELTPKLLKLHEKKDNILAHDNYPHLSKNLSKKLLKINKKIDELSTTTIKNRSYFSDSVGKYNMLEDIPKKFVEGLVKVLRVRGNGKGRSAFDLTSSVLINDHNFNSMTKSKVMFSVENDKFSELHASCFKKDFDSSLYETLRRLFVDFSVKYDIFHIKSLKFNQIDYISRRNPANTVVQLVGKQYSINIQKTMYSYHTNKYWKTRDVTNSDAFCFNTFKFHTTVGDSQLNFDNVAIDKYGIIQGKVTIDAPTRYFNHAACQSDVVDEYVREVKEINGETTFKYIMLRHEATFVMSHDKLIITIIPHVIL